MNCACKSNASRLKKQIKIDFSEGEFFFHFPLFLRCKDNTLFFGNVPLSARGYSRADLGGWGGKNRNNLQFVTVFSEIAQWTGILAQCAGAPAQWNKFSAHWNSPPPRRAGENYPSRFHDNLCSIAARMASDCGWKKWSLRVAVVIRSLQEGGVYMPPNFSETD